MGEAYGAIVVGHGAEVGIAGLMEWPVCVFSERYGKQKVFYLEDEQRWRMSSIWKKVGVGFEGRR